MIQLKGLLSESLVIAVGCVSTLCSAFELHTHGAMTATAVAQSRVSDKPSSYGLLSQLGVMDWLYGTSGEATPFGASYIDIGASLSVRSPLSIENDVIAGLGRNASIPQPPPEVGSLPIPPATSLGGWVMRGAIREDDNPIDNGRDMMGDDVPPDELNHAPRSGMHFGFPHCHGGDVPDPDFAAGRRCAEFTPPAQRFGAHVASLGMRFYTGTMFPPEYRGQAFIAEHGSWNRSRKSGYRVMRARIEGGKVVEHAVFAEGFLDASADRAWGRPVDVQVMPDGALLVSDDFANAIYRIAWRKPGS